MLFQPPPLAQAPLSQKGCLCKGDPPPSPFLHPYFFGAYFCPRPGAVLLNKLHTYEIQADLMNLPSIILSPPKPLCYSRPPPPPPSPAMPRYFMPYTLYLISYTSSLVTKGVRVQGGPSAPLPPSPRTDLLTAFGAPVFTLVELLFLSRLILSWLPART